MDWELLERNEEQFLTVISTIDYDEIETEDKIEWLLKMIKRGTSPEKLLRFMKIIAYEEDIDFLMAEAADSFMISDETLAFLANLTRHICSPMSIAQTLLLSDNIMINLPTIIRRTIAAYRIPEFDEHQWRILNQVVIDQQQLKKEYPPELVAFLQFQVNASRPPVPKPVWITPGSETPDMFDFDFWNGKVTSCIIEDPTHDIMEYLIIPPKKDEEEVTDPTSAIRRLLSVADVGNLTSNEWSSKLDRIWGPVNRILERDCITAPGGKGPCRMLTCQCREYDDEDEDDFPTFLEWWEFHEHRCQVCSRTIQQWFYAIRQPVADGGWVGCFCSFECLEEQPARPIFDEDAVTLGVIKGQIMSDGIADR